MGPRKQAVSKGPRALNASKGAGGKGGAKSAKGGKGAAQNSKASGIMSGKSKFQNNVRGMALLHKFGQNLLKNQGVCKKIVDACHIQASDHVLEIGPGTGNLTMLMLDRCNKLTAIDIDHRMIAELKKRACSKGYQNLDAKFGDAMKTELPRFNVLAANMPYQISSPFIFRLVKHLFSDAPNARFRCAVLMFQKEFSERLMARAGDKCYGRLSINVQMFFKVVKVCDVDRKSFNPPPKVDSMVVKLMPRHDIAEIDYREWDALLRIIYSRKNKSLRSSLCVKSVVSQLIPWNPHHFPDGPKVFLDVLSGEDRASVASDLQAQQWTDDEYQQWVAERRPAIIEEFRNKMGIILDETASLLDNQGVKMNGKEYPSGEKAYQGKFREKRARLCTRIELMALFMTFVNNGFRFTSPSIDSVNGNSSAASRALPNLFVEDDDGESDEMLDE